MSARPGAGSFLYDPTGSPWTFAGRPGVPRQRQRLHRGQPDGAGGGPGRLPPGDGSFSQTVGLGRRHLPDQLPGGAAGRQPDAAGLPGAGRRHRRRHVHALGHDATRPTRRRAFTVAAGSHTITFQGLDSAGGDNTAFVDAITVDAGAAPVDRRRRVRAAECGRGLELQLFVLDPPTGSPWTFTGSAGRRRQRLRLHRGHPHAPEGAQVAFLQADGLVQPDGARLGRRHLPDQLPGRPAGQLPGGQAGLRGAGRRQPSSAPSRPSGTTTRPTRPPPFTVAAGSHTITFQGLDTADGDNTAFIDAVSVSQVVARDDLAQYGVWTQDNKEFLLPEHVGDNIAVYYDAPNNQLVLGPVQVQGGWPSCTARSSTPAPGTSTSSTGSARSRW